MAPGQKLPPGFVSPIPKAKPKGKMKSFMWTKIIPVKVASTIWVKKMDNKVEPDFIDYEDIEKQFAAKVHSILNFFLLYPLN